MKLTEKIHLLRIDFDVILNSEKRLSRFVNVILILGEKITLIDTGVKGSEEVIFDYINELGRDASEIETVILSHSHPDHIGSAAKIKELTNCKILAHELEKEWIEDIDIQNEARPVPGFYSLVDSSVKVDSCLANDQEMPVDKDVTLKFIHTPGYSKGLLTILFKEDNILFTSDSIPINNDIPNYDDYNQLVRSLNSLKNLRDYNTLLTSWTAPIKNRVEISNMIKQGQDYMNKINFYVRKSYIGEENIPLEFCRVTIDKLGLPVFYATPIADKAFRSHLN